MDNPVVKENVRGRESPVLNGEDILEVGFFATWGDFIYNENYFEKVKGIKIV